MCIRDRGKPKEEARVIADRYLDLVGLAKFRDAKPAQLSGGQQQRVSIARALAVSPEVLFMDEPFAALDAINRLKMQDDIHRIAEDQNITTVFVTHDIEEAVTLADRIVIMAPDPGRIKSIIRVPVSYTHLDVYKRQVVKRVECFFKIHSHLRDH